MCLPCQYSVLSQQVPWEDHCGIYLVGIDQSSWSESSLRASRTSKAGLNESITRGKWNYIIWLWDIFFLPFVQYNFNLKRQYGGTELEWGGVWVESLGLNSDLFPCSVIYKLNEFNLLLCRMGSSWDLNRLINHAFNAFLLIQIRIWIKLK